jgi:hypothetical protein
MTCIFLCAIALVVVALGSAEVVLAQSVTPAITVVLVVEPDSLGLYDTQPT